MNLSRWIRPSVGQAAATFVGLAELLLALRVFLKFFFTTASGGFVHWAFSTTNVLLEPLRGVFPNPTKTPTNWHIDWVALFAMLAYGALASLMVSASVWGFGVRANRR